MALFPFILLRDEHLKTNKVLLNHERIHLQQELELLILPFYLLYICHYFINLARLKNSYQAYRKICFEKEAYTHETKLDYLQHRKFCSWVKYFK